jgi:hypothetical protein
LKNTTAAQLFWLLFGRIFAYCAIVFFGQFFEKCKCSPHFLATFFHGESFVLILTKMDWATFWAIF